MSSFMRPVHQPSKTCAIHERYQNVVRDQGVVDTMDEKDVRVKQPKDCMLSVVEKHENVFK